MPQRWWLVKQEPGDYPWSKFCKDGRTAWTGVRNFQARNHLRAMVKGDAVFYYHGGDEKQVVGLARVIRPAFADPTATAGDWSAVDLASDRPLPNPVRLSVIKSDRVLREMALVRQSRLSVSPVTEAQAARLLELAAAGA
jgi:predicted RNA-binding protein with PUA-like domain